MYHRRVNNDMGAENKQPDATSSASAFAQIDQVCDRFEAAWNAGQYPKMEDYLGYVPEALRAALESYCAPLSPNSRGLPKRQPMACSRLSRTWTMAAR